MADTCAVYTVNGLTINHASADTLLTDFEEGDIQGLDGAPIRRQLDPGGQTGGGIVFPALLGPRIITFKGKVSIVSQDGGDRLLYAAAVNAVEAAAVSALQGILNTTGTLSWTPNGGSAKSISVYYGVEGGEIQFTGNMLDKSFTFTLVAPNPTIS